MDATQMLHRMCHDALSNADVNAIRKSRGFSREEVATRALLENFFLSDIGVEAAIGALSKEEVVLLHLLKYLGEAVDITLFVRIYGDEDRPRYGTFTQRHKDVFKKVRRSLVRKGVLLFAETGGWAGDTKMERRRFRFPRQFERCLPPLIKRTTTFEGPGDVRPDVVRRKLMEIVEGQHTSPVRDKQYRLNLVGGELRMGDRPFRVRYLSEWRRACWESAAPSLEGPHRIGARGKIVSPVEATTYILGQLGENEWIRPGQLSLPLRIFCGVHVSGEEICAAGWEWGSLAKQEADGDTYYRLPAEGVLGEGPETGSSPDPKQYLYAPAGHPLGVNLETVPYQRLEQLAQISDLEVAGSGSATSAGSVQALNQVEGGPHLLASPNLIKLGNAPASLREQPLTQWLRDNAPAFRQALETVEQRWGKQIVHEDVLIAQVDDVALKVQLENAFPDAKEVVFLSNDFMVFPRQLLPAIERAVAKSGHVIRTVQPND
ncbi:MAG: hypothetical protein MAG451_03240 [Anaerolineales bacterium]|nr:hypothetical protein [Anaerolineales bacterium]